MEEITLDFAKMFLDRVMYRLVLAQPHRLSDVSQSERNAEMIVHLAAAAVTAESGLEYMVKILRNR
jgi:hypothetical protein